MESQRNLLIVGLLFVSFLLWQQWQLDYSPKAPATAQSNSANPAVNANKPDEDVPTSHITAVAKQPEVAVTNSKAEKIHVSTDTLDLYIDTYGGDVIKANLNDYSVTQGSEKTFSLLRPDRDDLYIAQSGLIGQDGPDGNSAGRPVYHSDKVDYKMTGNTLTVPLTWHSDNGLTVTKTFIFKKGHHDLKVQYQITNDTGKTISLQQYAQLKQTTESPKKKSGGMFMPTYRGSAYSTAETRYEKYKFSEIEEKKLHQVTEGGWVAMLEHYFVSAWIPPADQKNTLYSKNYHSQYAAIGFIGQPVTINNGSQADISSELYLGPKKQEKLAHLAKGLDLTVDYGILWWISQPLFSLLKFIHSLVGNWGLAIIIITIIVKGSMTPLTKIQYTSMGKMRALQPKITALKERYGDDRQKMSQAMMELYKKEKVNPMGGCFPMLLQMPIFLALYYVFLESVEFRHAPFFGWIHDLSVADPYYILPVLMGVSMFVLQRLNPATVQDPLQQKIMQWMPVGMTIFFLWFPAGLVLYWVVSNLITITQATLIYRGMEKKGIITR